MARVTVSSSGEPAGGRERGRKKKDRVLEDSESVNKKHERGERRKESGKVASFSRPKREGRRGRDEVLFRGGGKLQDRRRKYTAG